MVRNPISKLQKKMFLSAFITSGITEFTQILALTIDSIIVCRFLGAEEIAAVGVVSPFFFLVGIPSTCLATGLQTVCTREMGRGHIKEVNQRISETVLFTCIAMAVFMILVFPTVPALAWIFGARGNAAQLQPLASEYLYGLAFEAAPFVVMSVLTPVVVLDNGNRLAVISSVSGAAVNIVCDLLVIRSHGGLFGIGIASALSAVASMLVLLSHFLKRDGVIRLHMTRIRMRTITEVIRIGLPNVVHASANMLRSICLNSLVVAIGGSIGMTVLAIQETIVDFVDIASVGIAGAVSILFGLAYGERNGDELESVNILALRYIFAFSAAGLAILIGFREKIGSIFLDVNSEGWVLLLSTIVCIALSIPQNSLLYSRVSYLQAVSKEKAAQLLEAAANFCFLLLFVLLLSRFWGINGVFAAFPVAKAAVILLIVFVYGERTKEIFVPLREYLDVDGEFFPAVKDFIDYPVSSLEECVLSSEQVWLFCRGHHCSRRTALYLSLCAEEILTNCLKHGIRANNRYPLVELRVAIADGNLFMRIRDNGNAFNLGNMAKMLDGVKDPGEKLGLRVICAAADDIGYYRIYGMNNTIIRIKDQMGTPPQ